MSTAAERSQLRKSLLQLSSLLLLALLSLALLAQFAVWSLQRAPVRSDQDAAHLVAALDASRQVQVQFKRQVQEWKNVLLRGADPVERARYFEAFSGAEQRVSESLGEVATQLDALGEQGYDEAIATVRRQHAALGEQYRTAMKASAGGVWDPFQSDRAVRGLDRPIDTAIDSMAASILQESVARSARQQAEKQRRYEALRFGLWTAIGAALLLVGMLLWGALRALGTAH